MDTKIDSQSPSRVLGGGAAALLVVIAAVHLHLWLAGYRYLPTIGPLFLVAVISAMLLAVIVTLRINVIVALATVAFATGILTANVLSLTLPDGLFSFKEVGVSYSGAFAIASELGVTAILMVWMRGYARHRHVAVAAESTASSEPERRIEGQIALDALPDDGQVVTGGVGVLR